MKNIPYKRMQKAVEAAKVKDPGADRYVPGMTHDDVYVEVWRDGGAYVIVYKD